MLAGVKRGQSVSRYFRKSKGETVLAGVKRSCRKKDISHEEVSFLVTDSFYSR